MEWSTHVYVRCCYKSCSWVARGSLTSRQLVNPILTQNGSYWNKEVQSWKPLHKGSPFSGMPQRPESILIINVHVGGNQLLNHPGIKFAPCWDPLAQPWRTPDPESPSTSGTRNRIISRKWWRCEAFRTMTISSFLRWRIAMGPLRGFINTY